MQESSSLGPNWSVAMEHPSEKKLKPPSPEQLKLQVLVNRKLPSLSRKLKTSEHESMNLLR